MAEQPSSSSAESPQNLEFIKSEQRFNELIETNDRVLVDFYADWCGPCKMMEPVVSELAAECDAIIMKVDVESLVQIATRYGVTSIPTFISFNNGDMRERVIGMQNKETLQEMLE